MDAPNIHPIGNDRLPRCIAKHGGTSVPRNRGATIPSLRRHGLADHTVWARGLARASHWGWLCDHPVALCHRAGGRPHTACSLQPRASRRLRPARLPLLPFRSRNVALGGHSANRSLHDLPFPAFRASFVLAPVRDSLALKKPIVWARVHALPDYVYFDHSIHVAKEVGCTLATGRSTRCR